MEKHHCNYPQNVNLITLINQCAFQIKSFIILAVIRRSVKRVCGAHLRVIASFEEMSQRWRAVGNTVSDLTGLIFEPQTSRSRDESNTARPTGRFQRDLQFEMIHSHLLASAIIDYC